MMSAENTSTRRQRSVFRVHYGLPRYTNEEEPPQPYFTFNQLEFSKYESQVAGHQQSVNTKYTGMLKCNNGTVLKPVIKSELRKREINFYVTLLNTPNEYLMELKKYVPKYYGTKSLVYQGHENEYLILEEVLSGMSEPCIMDVKIGRRTWDPLATEEKIRNEQKKYAKSKCDVAFCIPGFQVFELETGKLRKYDKDYGKKLNGETVREAIKTFLNVSRQHMCRSLIMQFLTQLWKIQKWASKQTAVKLYSASMLLTYDAKHLRDCCGSHDILIKEVKAKCKVTQGVRRKSVHKMNSAPGLTGTSFSGQLSTSGPVYSRISPTPTTSPALFHKSFSTSETENNNTAWHTALSKLKRSHSFHHNYEDNLSKIKLKYNAMLNNLSGESQYKPWVNVKIIDFAHSFFNEDCTRDENFSEGVDNLVKIFEEFLHYMDSKVPSKQLS